jgi:hypothetical protein
MKKSYIIQFESFILNNNLAQLCHEKQSTFSILIVENILLNYFENNIFILDYLKNKLNIIKYIDR